MSGEDGVRKECAVMFKGITAELKTIRTNDLVHIHDDIKDIRIWIRTGVAVVMTAVAAVLAKVVFF